MADGTQLDQDFEALSVSRRLVRSVSQKWKKKLQKTEEQEDSNCTKGGVSMRCLSLYGRGGGCKVGAETSEEYGDPSSRRRSSASEEAKGYGLICGPDEIGLDCFPYGVKERFWRKNNRRDMFLDQIHHHVFLPDDILEMCLLRLPLTSLMTARLVCKKWRNLASTPRFLQMRREKSYRNPWLFLFGTVKDGFCSGEIHALDVSQDQWHKIQADVLKGKFMFSVATIIDDVYIVGGCSSLTNFGRVDRSSFKTHKGVLSFSPLTKSWRKVASMKYARSMPILGSSEVSPDFSISQSLRPDRRVPRSRLGGVSDVYEDPHRLSLRRQNRYSFDNTEGSVSNINRFSRQKIDQSSSNTKGVIGNKRFVLIVVGGLGSWDEPLDSGEIYDSAINKWTEIPRLPFDFGTACSGVVCNGVFYVYSENDKIMGFDIERGYWLGIHTNPFPPRVHEYYPKLVCCNNQLFMLSVSWCDGDGQIGRRNKAVRKLWQLDLMYLTWNEVSVHPDAPMDWNAAFVADKDTIFGVEMFKIFGQVLDFVTSWDVSDDRNKDWRHVSRNQMAHQLDSSSCMTKTLALVYL